MKTIGWVAGIALALASHGAMAQGMERAYAGFGLGWSDIDDEITSGVLTSGSVDGDDTGLKIYGGYRFSPNLAAEISYVDLGAATYNGDFFGVPVVGGEAEVTGFNGAAVLIQELGQRLEVFGKIGLFMWEAEVSDVTAGVPFSDTDDGIDLSFGFGANYYLTRNVGARVEWERFNVDPGKSSMLSASVFVGF